MGAQTEIAVAVLVLGATEFVRVAEAAKIASRGIKNVGLGRGVVGTPAVLVRGDGKNVAAAAEVRAKTIGLKVGRV